MVLNMPFHMYTNPWDLVETTVHVLNPIEEITVNINRSSFSVYYHPIHKSFSENSG